LANSTLRFSFEINRYIFWGGFSQQYGQMPGGFKNYIRYILGLKGGSDFLETDQLNVAGNQLGSYLFTVEKEVGNYHMELRVSHPFEDGSGMMLYNFKDNLYSFYVRKAPGSFIDEFLVEYMYSKNQSGNPCNISDKWKLPYGGDNYMAATIISIMGFMGVALHILDTAWVRPCLLRQRRTLMAYQQDSKTIVFRPSMPGQKVTCLLK